jgi:hypothetical protein
VQKKDRGALAGRAQILEQECDVYDDANQEGNNEEGLVVEEAHLTRQRLEEGGDDHPHQDGDKKKRGETTRLDMIIIRGLDSAS